jgi:hypothetical protein
MRVDPCEQTAVAGIGRSLLWPVRIQIDREVFVSDPIVDNNVADLTRRSFFAAASGAVLLPGVSACGSSYANDDIEVPDIEDGYIVFNAGGNNGSAMPENVWMTTIESALQWLGPESKFAYLGHECRAEGVDEAPFDDRKNYEFVGIKGWDGNYLIRFGVDLSSEEEYQQLTPQQVQDGFDFHVTAPSRVARRLGFEELLSRLQGKVAGPIPRTYFRVAFRMGSDLFAVYSRCKYINFPHGRSIADPYLQPIAGRVVVWLDGRLRLAYVAVHVGPSGIEGVQLKVLDHANFGVSLQISDFVRTVTLDASTATIDFYHY